MDEPDPLDIPDFNRYEDHYVLNEQHEAVLAKSFRQWVMFYESPAQSIKHDQVGHYRVSTIFLGLDHNHSRIANGGGGAPILFETMTFHVIGDLAERTAQERCSTYQQAMEQHERILAKMRQSALG